MENTEQKTPTNIQPCAHLHKVADPAIRAGSGAGSPHALSLKCGAPLDGNLKLLYINDCYRDPVNIFYIKMRNSLFGLWNLFDMFDELH